MHPPLPTASTIPHAIPEAGPEAQGSASRMIWNSLGVVCVGLGIVGALLPVIPTTVFLLGALTCFSRGSPRLERRLLDDPRFGPSLRAWRAERAIPARGRKLALGSMAATGLVVAATVPTGVAAGVVAVLAAVALYVGTRPEPRSPHGSPWASSSP